MEVLKMKAREYFDALLRAGQVTSFKVETKRVDKRFELS
jgi:hypothetical protein